MYLTNEKVAVLGAAGAIGSNLVQSLLQTGTANRISMYDPMEGPLKGSAEEIYHCSFPGAQVTWTIDEAEALADAAYIITAGGAPRRAGMTREDLRKDNCKIARNLGQQIKRHCPACKLAVVIFNPADITGLTTPGPLGPAGIGGLHPGRTGQHPAPECAGPTFFRRPGPGDRLRHLRGGTASRWPSSRAASRLPGRPLARFSMAPPSRGRV